MLLVLFLAMRGRGGLSPLLSLNKNMSEQRNINLKWLSLQALILIASMGNRPRHFLDLQSVFKNHGKNLSVE